MWALYKKIAVSYRLHIEQTCVRKEGGMVAQSRSIQILDPCPEEVPEARGRSAALPSIAGKVIGLLENRK
jgi:hypothetical protein